MPNRRRAPADTIFRMAVEGDIPALKQFRCENPGEPWTRAPELIVNMQVPSWIGAPATLVCVAERSEQIVGVIAVTTSPGNPSVYLSQVLAVAHPHRRLYIGYRLKLYAAVLVAQGGGVFISSEVDVENTAMQRCNDCFDAYSVEAPELHDTLVTVMRLCS